MISWQELEAEKQGNANFNATSMHAHMILTDHRILSHLLEYHSSMHSPTLSFPTRIKDLADRLDEKSKNQENASQQVTP